MDLGDDEAVEMAAHGLDGGHNLVADPLEIVVAEGGCDEEYMPQLEWAGSGRLEYGVVRIQVALVAEGL